MPGYGPLHFVQGGMWRIYSALRTVIGSARAAPLVATRIAASAINVKLATAPRMATGSVGAMPKTSDDMIRPPTSAMQTPATAPRITGSQLLVPKGDKDAVHEHQETNGEDISSD